MSQLSLLKNIELLEFENIQSELDIRHLEKLTNIKKFTVIRSKLINIESISKLINLEYLMLCHTSLKSIEFIKPLTKLKVLNIEKNNIEDISPISYLQSLHALYLSDNCIEYYSVISKLPNLSSLKVNGDISKTQLSYMKNVDILYENNHRYYSPFAFIAINTVKTIYNIKNTISEYGRLLNKVVVNKSKHIFKVIKKYSKFSRRKYNYVYNKIFYTVRNCKRIKV
jgi:Leucine-rich repeat (LRR) protein